MAVGTLSHQPQKQCILVYTITSNLRILSRDSLSGPAAVFFLNPSMTFKNLICSKIPRFLGLHPTSADIFCHVETWFVAVLPRDLVGLWTFIRSRNPAATQRGPVLWKCFPLNSAAFLWIVLQSYSKSAHFSSLGATLSAIGKVKSFYPHIAVPCVWNERVLPLKCTLNKARLIDSDEIRKKSLNDFCKLNQFNYSCLHVLTLQLLQLTNFD